jgi:hypothetical protein
VAAISLFRYHPLAPVIAFVIAVAVVEMSLGAFQGAHSPPKETPQQVERPGQRTHQQAELAEESERRHRICAIRLICTNYGRTRQACATAGNFDRCMDIKLGNQSDARGLCSDDGTMAYPPADMPTVAQCAVSFLDSDLK